MSLNLAPYELQYEPQRLWNPQQLWLFCSQSQPRWDSAPSGDLQAWGRSSFQQTRKLTCRTKNGKINLGTRRALAPVHGRQESRSSSCSLGDTSTTGTSLKILVFLCLWLLGNIISLGHVSLIVWKFLLSIVFVCVSLIDVEGKSSSMHCAPNNGFEVH